MEGDASSEGWTTGYGTGAEGDEFQFFKDDVEAIELLRGMEAEHGNDVSVAVQPYEIVRKARREAQARVVEQSTDQESATEADETRHRFEHELDNLSKRSKRKRRHQREDDHSEQDSIVKKLEAEATLLFAANKLEEGERICREVMRLAPNNADIYKTLGSMFENTGQRRKALDYYMIAAHLSPKNIDFWQQLSRASSNLGFHRQAVYCLTHILRADKNDINAHIDRALLYAELGENKRACDAFEKMSKMFPDNFEVVKMLGKLYHRMGHPNTAIETLEHTLLRYESQMDVTAVNILVDLYLQQGSYSEASTLIARTEGTLSYGETLPVDLKVKHGICALHTGDADTAYTEFADLLKEPISQFVDLYLMAGDALAEVKEYDQALNLFERLIETSENGPSLWERIVRCKESSDGPSAVVGWWLQFVESLDIIHPNYFNAALSCIKGLVDLGDLDLAHERMTSLNELLDSDKIHLSEIEKEATECLLLKESLELKIGKRQNSVDDMLPIVFHTLKKMKRDYGLPDSDLDFPVSSELMGIMERMQRRWTCGDKTKSDAGRERDVIFTGFRSARKEQRFARQEKTTSENESKEPDVASIFLVEDFVKGGEHYAIFMKVVDGLISQGRLADSEYFLTSAISISCRIGRTVDKGVRDAFRMKLIEVLRRLKRYSEALDIAKKLCSHWPYSVKVWNVYSALLRDLESSKWLTKFVGSYRSKYPASVAVILLMGQLLFHLGRQDMAVAEYEEALKILPSNPLLWLCLGIAKLHESLKIPAGIDRNATIVKAFCVLKQYERNRNNDQESCYNLGRACQQVGLNCMAAEYYKKALDARPADSDKDLSSAIAYNLMILYKNSGSIELARDVMKRHLTV